ncbi:MAG: membrane protein insertion efficiency factor YidD [Spirochaetes bacterium]|nr:membrane protein insertion efficiency factor YidD [Spirochaetota bacterium]
MWKFVAFYFSAPYHFAMMRPVMIALILFMFAGVFPLAAEETAYDVLVTEPDREESALAQVIRFYRERISSHDGARCLYYPTCSDFYRQAAARYGFFWGTVMIVDRMVYREDPASMSRYEYLEERGSFSDPVYHNYIFAPSDYYE